MEKIGATLLHQPAAKTRNSQSQLQHRTSQPVHTKHKSHRYFAVSQHLCSGT